MLNTIALTSKMMNCITVSIVILSAFTIQAGNRPHTFHKGSRSHIRNIIVLVPDGCNQNLQTLSRWYKGNDLMVDRMISGTVRTWSANSVVTGSAAAASAFATGFKVDEPFISVGPAPDKKISTYTWSLDTTDQTNPVLAITQQGISFRLPINKDELLYILPDKNTNVKKILSGVVVYTPKTGRVYIPRDAVD